MKYAIYRLDYEKFFTHGYGLTNNIEAKGENIVAYANTKKEASALVDKLGQFIAK